MRLAFLERYVVVSRADVGSRGQMEAVAAACIFLLLLDVTSSMYVFMLLF